MVSVPLFSQVSLLSVTYKTHKTPHSTITLGKTLTLLFVNSNYKNLNYKTGYPLSTTCLYNKAESKNILETSITVGRL